MRRRQIANLPKEPLSIPPPVFPKGVCPKCQKYIGRGVHFHTKACKG